MYQSKVWVNPTYKDILLFHPNFLNTYQAVATKDDHVVFISNEGEISAILANAFVEQLGSENIYTLVGGIQNWIKENI